VINLDVSTSGDLEGYLARLQGSLANLKPLGDDLAAIIVQGNERGILAGLDANDQPMAPVKAQDGRPGGPPLAPHGSASRVVTHFKADVQVTPGGLQIEAGWPDLPWLQFDVEGTSHNPARNIVGIRPDTMREIMTEIQVFTDRILNDGQA
jgi:hypothetical protein